MLRIREDNAGLTRRVGELEGALVESYAVVARSSATIRGEIRALSLIATEHDAIIAQFEEVKRVSESLSSRTTELSLENTSLRASIRRLKHTLFGGVVLYTGYHLYELMPINLMTGVDQNSLDHSTGLVIASEGMARFASTGVYLGVSSIGLLGDGSTGFMYVWIQDTDY